jgi:hypothetical protein
MTLPNDPPPRITWSPEARSAASLVIFMHLFALVVAVTTYTQPSVLQQRLHELFSPYLRTLHLTAYPVNYPFARYHLTHALPTDVDYSVQVDLKGADGQAETVAVPASGLQPWVRYRRYQALANATGTLADEEANEDFSGILPRAVAGAILRSRGATQGLVRCRAHYLPELEAMAEVAAGRREPLENFSNTYEAQVFLSGDSIELLKKSRTLDVAPVEGSRNRASTRDVAPGVRP